MPLFCNKNKSGQTPGRKLLLLNKKLLPARQEAAAAQQEAAAAQAALETTVRNLLKQGRFTIEEIADICGIAPDQARRLQPE